MVGTRTGTDGPIAHRREITAKRNWLHSSTALTGWASALPIAVIGAGLVGATPAHANPEGANVVAGGISIDDSTPKTLNINRSTANAIINWNSFSIKLDETTNFIQPSSSSWTLNRVTGATSSAILGTLTANGQIMLLNPNGILFGPNSRIDVAGLVATTLDIPDNKFLAGQFDFSGATDSNAMVVNQCTITVADGGLAAFVAPGVENSGIISARLGRVTLAAGDVFTLDLYGDQLVSLAVDGTIARQIVDQNGEPLGALVTNSGQITADGGFVMLSVMAAQGIVDNVINMSGIIQANSVGEQNGQIVLMGGDAGIVAVSGTLDASGDDAGETGGTVHVLGEMVGLFAGANVDVSGDAGGGIALIGGDFQGGGSVPLARRTYIAAGATIDASAITSGDGGTVIVWAEEVTRFYGEIAARGGSESGDGGFVETSGKDTIVFDGNVDTSAPHGNMGMLLLDPLNINITDGAGTAADNTAASDGSFLFGDNSADTADSTTGTAQISQATLEVIAAGTNITLTARNNITIENLTDDVLNLATTGSVTFTANADGSGTGDFSMNAGDTIRTQGASVTISAENVTTGAINTTGAANAAGGNVNITATLGTLTVGAITTTGGADVGNTQGRDAGTVTLNAATVLTTGVITATGSAPTTAANAAGAGGVVTLTGTTRIDLGGDINTSGGAADTENGRAIIPH